MACLFLGAAGTENTPSEETKDNGRKAREYSYSSYYPDEEKNKFTSYAEYPPSNYVTYKEGKQLKKYLSSVAKFSAHYFR